MYAVRKPHAFQPREPRLHVVVARLRIIWFAEPRSIDLDIDYSARHSADFTDLVYYQRIVLGQAVDEIIVEIKFIVPVGTPSYISA